MRGSGSPRQTGAGLVVTVRLEGTLAVLTLVGEARLEVVHTLEEAAAQVRAAGARQLILNCAGLAFMDSASIGSFLRLEQDIKQAGGRLVVCSLRRVIERMFHATGISGRFVLAPDEGEARRLASE